MLDSWYEFEKSFIPTPYVDWMLRHIELPVFSICIYLVIVFYAPNFLQKPFHVKPVLALWNATLSFFSIIGVTRTVPVLVINLITFGYRNTICDFRWLSGPSGLWTMMFIFSKFFELLDTAYLVLHKRNIIFLHWFHHVTVLLYCWHAYVTQNGHGLWFASMNFCVHSIMYFYYLLMMSKTIRPYVKKIGPAITTIQITQMAMGLVVSFSAFYYGGETPYGTGPTPCYIDPSNWKLGLAMYTCYFGLFVVLFFDKYIKKKMVQNTVCNATDAAGAFRGEKGGMGSETPPVSKHSSRNPNRQKSD